MINLIHNESCIKTLAKLKSNSIDWIITDPPYDKIIAAGWERECLRVLKDSGLMIVSIGDWAFPKAIAPLRNFYAGLILGFVDNQIPVRSGVGAGWCIYNMVIMKDFRQIKYGFPTIFWWQNSKKNESGHEQEVAENFYQQLYEVIGLKRGVIYDPFCGTGTALKVAKDKGLAWMGSEIDTKWANYSAERLKGEHHGL